MVQEAKFFRPIGINQVGGSIYTPCNEKDPGAVAKTLNDFKSSEIDLPPITMVNLNGLATVFYSIWYKERFHESSKQMQTFSE